jgi:hypothetical protein
MRSLSNKLTSIDANHFEPSEGLAKEKGVCVTDVTRWENVPRGTPVSNNPDLEQLLLKYEKALKHSLIIRKLKSDLARAYQEAQS